MEPPRKKTALAVAVVAAGIVTTAGLAMAVWPALTRPEPPAEATGDDGLRISLVEPPKALIARGSPLDVGLSEAAQAMAKGRETLFMGTPAFRPASAPVQAPARRPPVLIAQADEDDLAPPLEPVEDRWERERDERRFALAQQRREDERQARRQRDRRAAWEQDQDDRARWEEARERDRHDDRRYDDRYAPAPDDDRPPPERW